MDADAELGEALAIMFTVTASGLLVIIGAGILLRTRRRSGISAALMCSVLTAFWAWGLIRIKRLSFWLQRNGRSDQTFPLMPIHLFETVSSLMPLLIMLLFRNRMRPGPANLQAGMARMVMERLARPSALIVLVGLAITGYGMGVFFHGDLGVCYFVTIGLVVVTTGVWSDRDTVGHMGFVSLIVYVLVLLVATYIANDWQHSDFQ